MAESAFETQFSPPPIYCAGVGTDIEVRWAELAAIERVLDDTHQETTPAVVISGEPGIGKSHLLQQAVRSARDRGLLIVDGGLSEVEQALPWAGLGSLLRRVDEWGPTGLSTAQRQHLDRATRRITTGTVTAPEVAFAFAELIGAVAEQRPVVVAVDDLQWLDRPTAMALATVLRRTRCGQLTFLAAIRSGHESPLDLRRIGDVTVERIHLDGLSLAGVHRVLVHAGIEPPPRPQLVDIHTRSAGNPLRAIDLGRRGTNGIAFTADHSIGSDPAVAEHALEVGRLCALMVRPTMTTIGRLVPDSAAALSALERSGVVVIDGDEIRFTHALRQDAMLDGVGSVERRSMHRRIADVTDDHELELYHRAEAADAPDSELAATMERSAHDAERLGLPALAASRFRRAANLTPSDEVRERWARLGAFVRTSNVVGDLTHLDLALELADSAEGAAEIELAFMRIQELRAAADGSAAAIEACRSGLERLTESAEHCIALLRQVMRHQQFTDVTAGLATAEQLARETRDLSDPIKRNTVASIVASARCFAGVPIGPDLPDGATTDNDIATIHWAEVLVWSSRTTEAEQLLCPLVEAARQKGNPQRLVHYLGQLGDVHTRAGAWDAALAVLDESAQLSELLGEAGGGHSDRAWILSARGDIAYARHELALEAVDVPPGDHVWRVQHLARAGFVEFCAGACGEAANLFGEARRIATVTGLFDGASLPFGHDYVEVLLQLGRIDDAGAEADHLLAAATRAELPMPLALAWRSQALVRSARGDHAAAQRAIETAFELQTSSSDPFHTARTELAAGNLLRRVGRRAEARHHVELALRGFDQLGATSFSTMARSALDRLATRRAPADLTDTERRVAELAAAGRSNSEIAGELFVAVRTVESNLTRVYRKLGVRSRSQLAGALTPRT